MLFAAVVAEEVAADFFTAVVFLAGEVFAGLLRAVFGTGSDFFAAVFFLAAAVRWGADFLGADVAMVSYPLP
ncbi:hypothetical protein [Kribbella sp.]|uniref:hypothetical protein n=1 Tax=Kribbella sp. TaxID=1871183 RepID=UPI002D434C88|nr:hypothetical protein [Kribbella sp.]HZX02890.1 hypothetical protein [Kribbella sp.]